MERAKSDIFERFPDFIREFIYASGWEQLREVQVEAAGSIYDYCVKGRELD